MKSVQAKTPFRYLIYIMFLVLVSLGTINTIYDNWKITTDLSSLLPDTSQNLVANEWKTLSIQKFQNSFSLIVVGISDIDSLAFEARIEQIFADLEKPNAALFSPIDMGSNIDQLLSDLKPFRLNYLPPSLQKEANDNSLIESRTKHKLLNSIGSVLPGIEFFDDPLGGFSDELIRRLPYQDALPFAGKFILENEKNSSSYFLVASYNIAHSGLNLEAQEKITRAVDQFEQQLKQQAQTVSLIRAGPVFHASYAAKNMKADISLIASGSSLGILFLLTSLFFSWRPLLISVGGVAFGFVSAFIISSWIFKEMSFIVLVFGSALIGVSVDYFIHFFCMLYQNSEELSGTETYQRITSPLMLSLTSSVLGYSCLALSGLNSLIQIATFSSIGLISALMYLSAFSKTLSKPKANRGWLPTWIKGTEQLRGSLSAYKNIILLGVVLLTLACLAALAFNYSTNDNPKMFYHTSEKLIGDSIKANTLLKLSDPVRAILVTGENQTTTLNRLDIALAKIKGLEEQGLLTRITSIRDYVDPISNQQQNYSINKTLFSGNGPVVKALTDMGIEKQAIIDALGDMQSQPFDAIDPAIFSRNLPLAANLWFSYDNQQIAVIRFTTSKPAKLKTAIRALNSDFIIYLDHTTDIRNFISSLREKAQNMLFLATALVFALLWYSFSLHRALILISVPVVANLVSATILTTTSGISVFHIFAFFLVLGLGTDYAVFYQDQLKKHTPGIFGAIILSAITSLLSFGLLGTSETPLVGDFGQALSIGLATGLAGIILLVSLSERNVLSPKNQCTIATSCRNG